MAETMRLPVLNKAIVRTEHTQTQTKKTRIERWENIEGKFELRDTHAVKDKHLLLVDDVITTGATLESCGAAILQESSVFLSVATLCYAVK
jgi:predicted amidophosphoribosyltransferase